jgi:hypothetical protein
MQHAYVIAGGVEEGIARAEKFIHKELGMRVRGNPDVIVLRYSLLSMEEARPIASIAASASIAGDTKAIVIATERVYGEAQNALLKIFEEPPQGTYLFLILPSLGGLLPTLRSRVAILDVERHTETQHIPALAAEFIKMRREKRSAFIQKLATGKDEHERREHRDEALAIVNGLELAAYVQFQGKNRDEMALLLADISTVRAYLHAPSAPVRMILEHLSLTLPRNLL